MEGSSPQDKLKSSYSTALKKNWTVWPAVQLVNFKLVPLEHRVLVVNVVSLGKYYVVDSAYWDAADGTCRVELLFKLSE